MWFLDQLETQNTGLRPITYLVPLNLHFRGALNVETLQKALKAMVDRHEILRTYFIDVDGKPFQSIIENLDVVLPFIDLSTMPTDRKNSELQKLIDLNINEGFDLSKLPLFRFTLTRLENDQHILLMNNHHIISDGWSIEIILKEISHFYKSFSKGEMRIGLRIILCVAVISTVMR